MKTFVKTALAASLLALAAGQSQADQLLGTYVARISDRDHHASDGYLLDTAAQMVRQDRANVHKFGWVDAEDDDDPWFGTANARARFEKLLNKSGAMNAATRKAIAGGEPIVKVDVFANSVRVEVLGY
ncbi:MAG: hypothetical protein AB7I79_08010 [Rhizobiaceae bacterium]